MDNEDAERLRKSLEKFMDLYKTDPANWSKRSGITASTLYSFLAGKNNDIHYGTLLKLARGYGVTVGTITGESAPQSTTAGALNDEEKSLLIFFRHTKKEDREKLLNAAAHIAKDLSGWEKLNLLGRQDLIYDSIRAADEILPEDPPKVENKKK